MQEQIARWPTNFKGQSCSLLEENTKRWFEVKIDDVKEIPEDHHDSELRKFNQNEYVLVYGDSTQSLHTVYVDEYDASAKMVKCINSHGHLDPYPSIPLQKIVKLYRVTCTAVPGFPGIKKQDEVVLAVTGVKIEFC